MKRKILFALFLSGTICMSAQKQEFVGVSQNADMNTRNHLHTGSGVFYENQFSKHCGLETGLNLRSKNFGFYLSNPFAGFENVYLDIREDYLSLPVLFKFYSKIANLSSGFNVDYFVGWKRIDDASSLKVTSYSPDKRLYAGWFIKGGKAFEIAPKLVFEPELYFNPLLGGYGSYYGASLKLKYKL